MTRPGLFGNTATMRVILGVLLAGMLLLAGVSDAGAQEGLGTVVCVGSELERVAGAGPVSTVIQEDVEVVYRGGVEYADRDAIEARLLEELSQTEVRCAWSDPGNSHVVVLSYTGVIPLDLTIDPDDPRFTGFSVGYGMDFDGAESNARIDARFDTYYDGGGYEVILREEWNAGGARPTAAAGAGREEPLQAAPADEGAAESERPPGARFRDCTACPEMVVVPAGSFMMGSPASEQGRYDDEEPRHRVTIGAPLAVGVYEVTFAEWDACLRANWCGGYWPEDEGWGRGSRPVINVSWEDAQEYVRWLSRETGEAYRLLTEAEWEYAARAGTQTARYWGESESGQCRYMNGYDATGEAKYDFGWMAAAGCSDGYAETAPVGSFQPNAFGLYDALGNVWEWTADCWNDDYLGAPADGTAWGAGDCSQRVLRGGSWDSTPGSLRSASRDRYSAGNRLDLIGFRVARTMN